MNLELTEEQRLFRDSFARFFDANSSMERVRLAENGFDDGLWEGLAALGTFCMRTPVSAGGMELGTLDATILMEEVGRTLATGPILETILAARILARADSRDSNELLEKVLSGKSVVTLAYHNLREEPVQWISGGEKADYIIVLDGEELLLVENNGIRKNEVRMASTSLVEMDLAGGRRFSLARGLPARETFCKAIEEWKILLASALVGLSRRAIELAAEYAGERKAFGQHIGTFQAISHPLAVLITDVDAAKYLIWKTLKDIDEGSSNAGAQISLCAWWATDVASRTVSQALHTFGGYGLTTDYDIHMYNLRAKAWSVIPGDPSALLEEGARRLYGGETGYLPDIGAVTIDFDRGVEAREIAKEMSHFFEENLTPELRSKAHFTWKGFDSGFHKQLAKAGLLFPDWPRELGGREISPYAAISVREVYENYGWSAVAPQVARMVGLIINRFGSDELKETVLKRIASGDAVCSLGWSEPTCGSDVFAAQTRAIRTDDGWHITGQKMFTSGAEVADYVYLIARTNTEVSKHKGITMFIVPLDTPGISIRPVNTFQDEPTTITFYDSVAIPDSYRIGEVDGGIEVMSATLEIEHSASYAHTLRHLLSAGEDICRKHLVRGRPIIEQLQAKVRLARIYTLTQLASVLNERMLWANVEGQNQPGYGPMARLQSAEAFFDAAKDLFDLTAPSSLSSSSGPAAFVNQCYRHGHAARIYGGSQEILRSQIAERHLGMPRTRA